MFLVPKVPFISLWSLCPAFSVGDDEATIDANVALIFLTAWLIDDLRFCATGFGDAGVSTTVLSVAAGMIGAAVILFMTKPSPVTLPRASVLKGGSCGGDPGACLLPSEGKLELTVLTGEKFQGLLLASKLTVRNSRLFAFPAACSALLLCTAAAFLRRCRQNARSETAAMRRTTPPAMIPASFGTAIPLSGVVLSAVCVGSVGPAVTVADGPGGAVADLVVGAELIMVIAALLTIR